MNTNNTNRAAFYVAKIGDLYVAPTGDLVDSQRGACRMADDDRIPAMRSVLDSFYLMARIPAIDPANRLRLVRVNCKAQPTTDAIVDQITTTNDRPHVYVVKSGDHYYVGSDLPLSSSQRSAYRFATADDAQATIDRESVAYRGIDWRIVRVNLKQTPIDSDPFAGIDPIDDGGDDYSVDGDDSTVDETDAFYNSDDDRAIDTSADDDRPFVYVVKDDDLYVQYANGYGSFVDRQKDATWFATEVDAQRAINTATAGPNAMRIVRVRLNSAAAIDRLTALQTPPVAIDRPHFYVVKSGDLYLTIGNDLTQYQRKAQRFASKDHANTAAVNVCDGRIVKVNAR